MRSLITVTLAMVAAGFITFACAAQLPDFFNGIDENYYLAWYTGRTYTEDSVPIPASGLPYAYFASKGVNFARIRCWCSKATWFSPRCHWRRSTACG